MDDVFCNTPFCCIADVVPGELHKRDINPETNFYLAPLIPYFKDLLKCTVSGPMSVSDQISLPREYSAIHTEGLEQGAESMMIIYPFMKPTLIVIAKTIL